jgi:hypothetical protein
VQTFAETGYEDFQYMPDGRVTRTRRRTWLLGVNEKMTCFDSTIRDVIEKRDAQNAAMRFVADTLESIADCKTLVVGNHVVVALIRSNFKIQDIDLQAISADRALDYYQMALKRNEKNGKSVGEMLKDVLYESFFGVEWDE